MTLALYKFGPQWGISDPSPFCVKLESFLRLNDIDYKLGDKDIRKSLGNAPKKKLPFVVFENGESMGDSQMIIRHICETRNINMNTHLNDQQKATSHAFCRMLDEATYFVALYSRWVDEPGFSVVRDIFFAPVPALLRGYVSEKFRQSKIKALHRQGTGRHSREEIYAIAARDMDALSTLLGDDEWFFGSSKPTLLDIWAHAFVIQIIVPPIDTPLKEHTLFLKNLCDHATRFQEKVYGT